MSTVGLQVNFTFLKNSLWRRLRENSGKFGVVFDEAASNFPFSGGE